MAKATTPKVTFDIEEVKQAAQVNLINNLQPKTFNSGKTGFYAQGKITINGTRFQSQVMLVEITPKA